MFITSQDRDFTKQNKYPQLVWLLMSLLLPLLGILQNKRKTCVADKLGPPMAVIRSDIGGNIQVSNRNMESICFKL